MQTLRITTQLCAEAGDYIIYHIFEIYYTYILYRYMYFYCRERSQRGP